MSSIGNAPLGAGAKIRFSYAAKILFRVAMGSVSHAVRKTAAHLTDLASYHGMPSGMPK